MVTSGNCTSLIVLALFAGDGMGGPGGEMLAQPGFGGIIAMVFACATVPFLCTWRHRRAR